jgi:hypothetical protein
MKKVLSLALFVTLFVSTIVTASIPVSKNGSEQEKIETSVQGMDIESIIAEVESQKNDDLEETISEATDSSSSSDAIDNELLITLLLWFFLGFLAGHRWYRGKPTGWNILFILTGGGCGIWAIVDLVHILTGKF